MFRVWGPGGPWCDSRHDGHQTSVNQSSPVLNWDGVRTRTLSAPLPLAPLEGNGR